MKERKDLGATDGNARVPLPTSCHVLGQRGLVLGFCFLVCKMRIFTVLTLQCHCQCYEAIPFTGA